MELETELRAVLAEQFAVDASEVVPAARLQDDLGADSLMLMALAEYLSGRYKITIEPDEIVDLVDVAALVDMVRAKLPV